MPTTMATLTSILKEVYEPQIREQLNNDVVGLRRIEKTSEGVYHDNGGRGVFFPVHTKRNPGIGARTENEALPTAGSQSASRGQLSLKNLYGQLDFSGQVFELAAGDPQAFVNMVDFDINGIKVDLVKDLSRQLYGNGVGAVAVINDAATASTHAIKASPWLQDGMIVDVYTADGFTTQKAASRTISYDPTNPLTVTFSGATFATVVGDIIVRTGNGPVSGTVRREITGLGAILASSGVLYGIDPAVDVIWKAFIDSNSGTLRSLSEGLMINAVDTVRTRGSNVSVGLCNLGVRRAYFNLLSQQRKYTNTKDFGGGFSGLSFTTDQGDIPIVVDVDAPYNTLNFLTESQLKWYKQADFAFMDRDGSMFNRVPGFDRYQATLFSYVELGTHRRNAHAQIQDITEG